MRWLLLLLIPIFTLPVIAETQTVKIVRRLKCRGEVSSLANNTKTEQFIGQITDIKTDAGYKTQITFKAEAEYAFESELLENDPIYIRDAEPNQQTDELGQFLKDQREPQNYMVVQSEREQINKKSKKYYVAYAPIERPNYQWIGQVTCKLR